jgi:hypothetical protein
MAQQAGCSWPTSAAQVPAFLNCLGAAAITTASIISFIEDLLIMIGLL